MDNKNIDALFPVDRGWKRGEKGLKGLMAAYLRSNKIDLRVLATIIRKIGGFTYPGLFVEQAILAWRMNQAEIGNVR